MFDTTDMTSESEGRWPSSYDADDEESFSLEKLGGQHSGVQSDGGSVIYPADGLTASVAIDVVFEAALEPQIEGKTTGEIVNELKLEPNSKLPCSEQMSHGARALNAILTTRKELFAWWLYYFAYEPISAVAFVLLIPLLLQDLAHQVGHILGTPQTPCPSASQSESSSVICVLIQLGQWNVTPSAFAYYTLGLSVAMQAVTFISVGALADYGKMRKGLLTIFTFLGCFSAIAMVLVFKASLYWLAALLTILLNIFYGTSSVFYNAYLPLLVQNHPKYLKAAMEQTPRQLHKIEEKLSSFISTVGIAAGYFAGILVILAVIGYFRWFGSASSGPSLQLCIAACGLWWLAFSLYSMWSLKSRPGPPLPEGSNFVSFSWKKLMKTLRKCRRLPTTFSFLMCYLFYSDGYSTMGSAAILIARQSMAVSVAKLTLCALIAPICALVGTLSFFFLQRLFRVSSKTMLVVLLLALGCIPIYCALGLVSKTIGLRQEWEIYAITSAYGLVIGAAHSFSRVVFAELIPLGEESEFFSLYAVTDKGSAFLGPLVVAVLSDWTNEPRFGLIFLAALILLPIPFLVRFVNVDKGKAECQQFRALKHKNEQPS